MRSQPVEGRRRAAMLARTALAETEREMAEMNSLAAQRLAEAVRAACVKAALEGYEQARMDGLCDEGALEVALDAVRGLNLAPLLAGFTGTAGEE